MEPEMFQPRKFLAVLVIAVFAISIRQSPSLPSGGAVCHEQCKQTKMNCFCLVNQCYLFSEATCTLCSGTRTYCFNPAEANNNCVLQTDQIKRWIVDCSDVACPCTIVTPTETKTYDSVEAEELEEQGEFLMTALSLCLG
jgi:hypothetical protein